MSLRVSNIRLGIDTPESELPSRVGRLLEIPVADLGKIRILRKSLDARDKDSLAYVYVTEVPLTSAPAKLEKLLERARRRNIPVEPFHEEPFIVPDPGREPLPNRPVVVGSGPAGLLAGYVLAEMGYKPLVLERGRAVRDRIRDVKAFDEGGAFDPESNYLFGEGGAGTFSDGKLTYRGNGADVRQVLEIFAKNNGKPSILYEQRPHLGSNRLPAVVKKLRTNIEAMGGEVRYGCKVEDLDIADGRVRGVITSSGRIPAEVVLMGPLHHAPRAGGDARAQGLPVRRAHRAAAGGGQPREIWRRPPREQDRPGRLQPRGARLTRLVHLLHVRGRLHHAQRVARGRILHQRHVAGEPRQPVRQQRPGGYHRARGIRRRRSAGRRPPAGEIRARGLRAGTG
jgi:uncharacterized FAD-dependent dehydrogenase